MSLFTDASLVMIPSGVKDGKLYSIKPDDGVGDFTFTRGSNLAATRVDENGLIEKGRENLLLQSNNFSTTWTTSNLTPTSGQSGYDGSSDAWKLDITAASGFIGQNVTSSGVQTYSVRLKQGTLGWVSVNVSGTSGAFVYFDLVNGVKGNIGPAIIDSGITSVGNGYYLCSITFNGSAGAVRIFPVIGNADLTATSGNIYIQDAQLELGLVATDYIETGATTEQAGILENLPRLDYTDSSCPSLLLEPTRTNVLPYSENTTLALNSQNSTTVTANAAISPEGKLNADEILFAPSSYRLRLVSITADNYYTASLFFKNKDFSTGEILALRISDGVIGQMKVDVKPFDKTIVVSGADAAFTNRTGGIEDYGNGWSRVYVTGKSVGGIGAGYLQVDSDISKSVYLYGFQLEAGSYPTSYIPTYGTSVTRSGDVFDLTNIQSKGLFGTESGFAFYDFKSIDDLFAGHISNIDRFQHIDIAGVGGGYFRLRGFPSNIILQIVNLSASVQSLSIPNGSSKICIVWDIYNFSLFVDGVKIGSLTTTSSIAVNTIGAFGGLQGNKEAYINKILWGNAALTDQEAIALTTI